MLGCVYISQYVLKLLKAVFRFLYYRNVLFSQIVINCIIYVLWTIVLIVYFRLALVILYWIFKQLYSCPYFSYYTSIELFHLSSRRDVTQIKSHSIIPTIYYIRIRLYALNDSQFIQSVSIKCVSIAPLNESD